jgi:hypothetical protein
MTRTVPSNRPVLTPCFADNKQIDCLSCRSFRVSAIDTVAAGKRAQDIKGIIQGFQFLDIVSLGPEQFLRARHDGFFGLGDTFRELVPLRLIQSGYVQSSPTTANGKFDSSSAHGSRISRPAVTAVGSPGDESTRVSRLIL